MIMNHGLTPHIGGLGGGGGGRQSFGCKQDQERE